MMSMRVFNIVCCVIAGVCCVGCGKFGTRQEGGAGNRGIVVSPLSVQVADPKLLLSVNSIVIEKPFFRQAEGSMPSEDTLLLVLKEVAGETLSMRVVDDAKVTKGRAGDSVLRTEIVAMDDLKGSKVGGTPARVAFRMWVFAPHLSQRPVWQANYVYQQEAVTENLLKLKDRLGKDGSGPGWITAQQIFRRGVYQSLADLNSRRDALFQSKDGVR